MDERACRSVGIDLGTTYSSLAYMDAGLTPRVVADESGQAVVPSVIFFDDDAVIVGDVALQNARLRADRVVQFVKLHMGEPWTREILGRTHTPESLSALILAHLVREAEPQVGPIPSAVITVPAFFTEKRRRATEQAGRIAGLDVLGTLNEPMAAALAYGMHRRPGEQTVLVYDLGGGTFDVTIVRIAPGELEEVVTYGNRRLGGKDWDDRLIDHVVEEFRASHGADPRESPEAMQGLQIQCEQAKRRLSKMARTTIVLDALGRERRVEVARDQFEAMTAHLVEMTRLTTEMALADAGLGWADITRVLLVGGSTHMPMVRAMLAKASGKPPDSGVNPVIAVSLGAAIYAHLLETGRSPKTIRHAEPEPEPAPEPVEAEEVPASSISEIPEAPPLGAPPKVRFVTAHGVGVLAYREDRRSNVILIPKNRRVPAATSRRFRTRRGDGANSGRLRIEITQGDAPDVELVEVLGTLVIEGLPPDEPAGQPVDVCLTFDAEGRLHAAATHVPTGRALGLSLEIPGGLREEQVEAYRQYLREAGLYPGAGEEGPSG